jgi:hypothetical protein
VSATSPTTGATSAETEVAKAKAAGREHGKEAKPSEAVEVHLEHARWRHFGWMMFGLVAGVLLVWIFGIVAKVLGIVFLLIAAVAGYGFVRTLLHPPGRIVVGDGKVTLPAGLCRGVEHRYDLDQVRHAFFLRRAVPWTRASPVLVIEVAERAFSYPRDWFVSERNQRRVAEAINGHLGRGADA